jgi:hypothetical protein
MFILDPPSVFANVIFSKINNMFFYIWILFICLVVLLHTAYVINASLGVCVIPYLATGGTSLSKTREEVGLIYYVV